MYLDRDVEARRDDSALVQTTDKLDDDLARSVIIDDLELSDVACGREKRRTRQTNRKIRRKRKR